MLTMFLLLFVIETNAQINFQATNVDIPDIAVGMVQSNDELPALRRGEFGIRYLPTFSSLQMRTYNGDVVIGKYRMSQGFGIMGAFNLNKHFGIQGEINYYQVSHSYDDKSLNREINLSYLNIPLLFSLNSNKTRRVNFNLVVGPQFGFIVKSTMKTTGTEIDTVNATLAVRRGDVGLAYGAGLEIALDKKHIFRLDLGFRGFVGFVNVNANNPEPGTYNVIVNSSRKTYGAYIGFTLLL